MNLPKYRVWEPQYQILGAVTFLQWLSDTELEVDFEGNNNEPKLVNGVSIILEKSCGKNDKAGRELFFGDLVKIKRTLSDGTYRSEAIYLVEEGALGGIRLSLQSLVENDDPENQYPIDQNLCEEYGSLGVNYRDQKYDQLAVLDTWGENSMRQTRWKSSDFSADIGWVGTRHQNPELLRGR